MERTKIKNLARQIRGVSYKQEDLHDSLDDTAVILLRANNIDEGKINFDDVVYVDKSKVSNEQYLKVGDVLLCASSGSKQLVGKAASVDFDTPCTFGAFCKVVRPNNDVADYLGKYFQSGVYRRKISEVAIGANINNIRNEHIDSLDIPIYESDQVRGIVEKIGLLQNIIDNRKCELSKLDELIKARFVEMFGDPIYNTHNRPTTEFINVVKMQRGFDLPVQDRQQDGAVPVYGSNGALDCHDVAKIQGGGVITGRSGTIGKVFYTEGDYWPLNTSLFSVDTHGNNVIYLAYLLELYDLTRFVEGTGVPTLNRNMFHTKQIIDVGIDEQNQFAAFVKQVDKSKVVVKKALDEAQILFDSLMQEYFG